MRALRCAQVITKLSRANVVMAALVGLGGVLTAAAADVCPTTQLAPLGLTNSVLAPHCALQNQNNCLVTFSGYQWWTAFNYSGAYHSQYFFNGGLETIFAPEHVFVDGQGLHLVVNNDANVGDPKFLPNMPWSGAEAVAMFDGVGNEVNFGYGDYLVTVQSSTPLNAIDPNVAVGMFTYERYGTIPQSPPFTPIPTWGGSENPNREIDLAEISRWGWNHNGACPFSGKNGQFPNNALCHGNAQFATQIFNKSNKSVERYDIGLNNNQITLVMRWRAGEVTFLKFNGAFTLGNLPTTTKLTWTAPTELMAASDFQVATDSDLQGFIPNPASVSPGDRSYKPRPTRSCERFHLNFWTGYYGGPRQRYCPGCNPGPTDNAKKEVIITNFQYAPM
jgi:hypothetical protein